MADRVFRRAWRKSYPVAARAKGVYVYDEAGNGYLDAVGGVYVVNIGHGVQEVLDAMATQAAAVAFPYGGSFTTRAELELAEEILQRAPAGMAKAYFVGGGSEANEVAIKIARKYQLSKGRPERWRVVGRWQSYHGATVGAMSASGHTSRRTDFQPYLLDFPHIPPPYCYRCPWRTTYPGCGVLCAEELERVIRQEGEGSIAAFIAEPIGGASLAALVPVPEYYPRIREICDRYDLLFIDDEVITGFGRTGANFAIQHYGVTPDIITSGKGIGSGYAALGAMLVHEKVLGAMEAHYSTVFTGYTYSGHPIACAAGLAVLRYIEEHKLVDRVREEGEWFLRQVGRLRSHPSVGEVRGKGLLAGIEFVADQQTREPFAPEVQFAKRVADQAWERKMIVHPGGGGVEGVAGEHILLAPPFVASRQELARILEILEESIAAVEAEVFAAGR